LTKQQSAVKHRAYEGLMQFAVVCSVKNEGPFLVEWVSWYRMLGFTRIIVVSNDCSDRSPALLDALAAAGWLTHLRCEVPPGRRIEATKLAYARKHALVFKSDWVFVCDVDEFLIVNVGRNQVQDLVAYPDQPFLGMAINWRVFGDSGHKRWEDGLTHRQFTHAAQIGHGTSRWFKSLFTKPRCFMRLDSQGPRGLNMKRAGLPWGAPGMVWINSDGTPIPEWRPDAGALRMLLPDQASVNVAQLNHYMVRSQESYSLKQGTLSAAAGVDRYTDDFYLRYNRNEMHEDSALLYAKRFAPLHQRAMALPGVARLHHQCCADYVGRLCAKAGKDAAMDPRWQQHMDLAASVLPA
jgi:Glycosyl transferase family 2